MTLEEHAAEGRKLREREARAPASGPRRPWWRRIVPRRRLHVEALAGDVSLWLVPGVLLLVAAGYGLHAALAIVVPPPWPELVCVVAGLAALAVMMVLYERFQLRRADATRRWLRQLPLHGDWLAYENALGKERMETRVHVRAHFRTALVDATAERVADAARGMVKKGTTACTAQTLVVDSPALKTWFQGNADRESRHSNLRVHAWVRRTLVALLAIHREHPIDRVEIDVRG